MLQFICDVCIFIAKSYSMLQVRPPSFIKHLPLSFIIHAFLRSLIRLEIFLEQHIYYYNNIIYTLEEGREIQRNDKCDGRRKENGLCMFIFFLLYVTLSY